jgi:hypothetical protein
LRTNKKIYITQFTSRLNNTNKDIIYLHNLHFQEKIDQENKYDSFTKYASAEASKENDANGGPLPFGGLMFPDYKPNKAEIELLLKKKKVVNTSSKKDKPKKIDKTLEQ